MNPLLYGQLTYDRGGKNMQWGKDRLFSKWCWENQTVTCKRSKLECFLTPYTNINSKCIKGLSVRPETIKLLEENISSMHSDISLSNIFLCMSHQSNETKAKLYKWDYIKLKSFCTVKETILKNPKRPPTEWQMIFAIHCLSDTNNVSDKGLISKI